MKELLRPFRVASLAATGGRHIRSYATTSLSCRDNIIHCSFGHPRKITQADQKINRKTQLQFAIPHTRDFCLLSACVPLVSASSLARRHLWIWLISGINGPDRSLDRLDTRNLARGEPRGGGESWACRWSHLHIEAPPLQKYLAGGDSACKAGKPNECNLPYKGMPHHPRIKCRR